MATIDLHGNYPADLGCEYGNAGKLSDYIQQAWEKGDSEITFIHGWGRHSGHRVSGANTNTGYLGLCVRKALRLDTALRQWIQHTRIECGDPGTTTVRLKSNPSPKHDEKGS